jgi:autotransporter-associated beta strand protein
MILGDPSAPGTITMSTATGQNLTFTTVNGPIVVNDLMQDSTGIAGQIAINTAANNNNAVTFNAANTFTGNASLGGGSTAASGQVRLGTSTDGDFGAINSGPLGKGTIVAVSTNATNTPPLTPFNADRTLSNAVNITGNFATANAPSQNFNLNLTGPITMTATASRTLNNTMTGTLTLGKATVGDSTNPVTLSGTANQTLTFTGGASSTTVVNDVIQNGGSGLIPGLVGVSGSTVRFNNANTYTGTTTVSSTGKLLVNNTSGSGTGTGNVSMTGGTIGGTGTISQSVTASGGAVAPGDPLVNNGVETLNIGTNLTFSSTGGLTVDLGGSTTPGTDYDQVIVTGTANVSAAGSGTLTVNLVNGFSPSVDTDFTVLTATSLITGPSNSGFGNVVFPAPTNHWSASYNATSIVVHYSAVGSGNPLDGGAVPEPGSIALVLGAMAFGFASPRRFRRVSV